MTPAADAALGQCPDMASAPAPAEVLLTLPEDAPSDGAAYLRSLRLPILLHHLCVDLLSERPTEEEFMVWLRTWASWRTSAGAPPIQDIPTGRKSSAGATLPYSAVSIIGELGYGLFGRMYSAVRKGPSRKGSLGGRQLVLEEAIPLGGSSDLKVVSRLRQEREVLNEIVQEGRAVRCAELQRVIGLCEAPLQVYIMSDAPRYVAFPVWVRSLKGKDQRLSLYQLARLAVDVAAGLERLHGAGLVHGAITLNRVYCDAPECDSFVLWDTGLWHQWWGVRLPKMQAEQEAARIPMRKPSHRELVQQQQLRRVLSPEDCRTGEPSRMSDVWAYGLLLRDAALYAPEDLPLLAEEEDHDVAVARIAEHGSSLFPQPYACPTELWSLVIEPCLRAAAERPKAAEVSQAATSVAEGEVSLQDGASSDHAKLSVPFQEDDLSFLQFNVPAIRREVVRRMEREQTTLINVSAVTDTDCRTLDRSLEEIAKAIALSRKCSSLHLTYPEGQPSGQATASLKGFGEGTEITGSPSRARRPAASAPSVAALVQPATFSLLADGLSTSPKLRELCIDALPLGAEGVDALSRVIHTSATLQALEIGNTDVGDQPLGRTLCDSLLSEAGLRMQRLALCGIGLGDAAVAVIATALRREGCALRVLQLGWNRVGHEGARSLALALCGNSSLRTLDLVGNCVEDGGAEQLAQSLRRNTTLDRMDVQFNGLTVAGAWHILSALESRPHISCYSTEGLLAFWPSGTEAH